MAGNKNLLNYVDYDFDKLVNQLVQRLQQDSEAWKDTYRSSTGQMLIELFSYVGNMVLYYIERRAEESYLETAQNLSSVMNLVKLINYKPKRKVSSKGVLKFSLSSPASKNIFIKRWTQCSTADGVPYVTVMDVTLLAGQTEVEVDAIQGKLVSIEITSDGAANQEYKINDVNVEHDNLYVYVDNDLWSEVSSFLESKAESRHYRVRQEYDRTLRIMFGDGVKGKIPPAGSTVLIQYIKSDGVAGNATSSGVITKIDSPIYDSDGTDVTQNVSVTNDGTFLGGDDEEDIEEIKNEAPRVFKTGDRAVTKEDYIAIIENYAGVANANVWGEAEENPPNVTMFNRVRITVLLQDWLLADDVFKQNLMTFLYNNKAQLTVHYEFVDPTILLIVPVLDVKVKTGYSLSTVQQQIEDVLSERFELGKTTRLGTHKRISDLIHAVDDLPGVSYHHMTLEVKKTLVAGFDGVHDYGENLDALPLLKQSVRVFINNDQIAVDDGNGGFTPTSTYTVSGTVNYTDGSIGIDIDPAPAPTDVVYVRYQQDANRDIVVTNNQICKLDAVDITGISYE